MSVEGQEQPPPEKFLAFMHVFEQYLGQTARFAEISEKLFVAITHPKDGLIATLDDVTESMDHAAAEWRALREDLRTAARQRGLEYIFDTLKPMTRRR